jgi:hypothetical protein
MNANLNTGHGHVRPRPDGVRARCGGPGMCPVCSTEKCRLIAEQETKTSEPFRLINIQESDAFKRLDHNLRLHGQAYFELTYPDLLRVAALAQLHTLRADDERG